MPATHVAVPETHVTVPGTHFAIPKIKINVPGVDADKLSNEISHEIDRSMSVANSSMKGAIAQSSSDGGRNCSGCDYRRVDWSGRDLRGVNYEGVDLTGARLVGTWWSWCIQNDGAGIGPCHGVSIG